MNFIHFQMQNFKSSNQFTGARNFNPKNLLVGCKTDSKMSSSVIEFTTFNLPCQILFQIRLRKYFGLAVKSIWHIKPKFPGLFHDIPPLPQYFGQSQARPIFFSDFGLDHLGLSDYNFFLHDDLFFCNLLKQPI